MFASPGSVAFQVGPLVVRWYGILMATAIVVVLPCVVIFFVAQKQIVGGVSFTGSK